MKPTKSLWRTLVIPLSCTAMTGVGSAASLALDAIQRVDQPGTFAANLTAGGTRDWAYWASTNNPVGATMAPTNDKTGGGTIISSLSAVGDGQLRGTSSGASTVGRYSWSDGSVIGNGSGVDLDGGLIFNTTIGTNAAGKGLSFTISGLVGQENYAVIYLGGYGATGTLTLSLAGATSVFDSSQIFAASSPKPIVAYQVKFTPDNPGDLLTVQYTASSVTDVGNGHVGIDAVTVGLLPVIPEPAIALLGSLGGLILLGRRCRR